MRWLAAVSATIQLTPAPKPPKVLQPETLEHGSVHQWPELAPETPGPQIHPPAGRCELQATWPPQLSTLGSSPTQQQTDIQFRNPRLYSQLCRNELHPPAGQHQIWDPYMHNHPPQDSSLPNSGPKESKICCQPTDVVAVKFILLALRLQVVVWLVPVHQCVGLGPGPSGGQIKAWGNCGFKGL